MTCIWNRKVLPPPLINCMIQESQAIFFQPVSAYFLMQALEQGGRVPPYPHVLRHPQKILLIETLPVYVLDLESLLEFPSNRPSIRSDFRRIKKEAEDQCENANASSPLLWSLIRNASFFLSPYLSVRNAIIRSILSAKLGNGTRRL